MPFYLQKILDTDAIKKQSTNGGRLNQHERKLTKNYGFMLLASDITGSESPALHMKQLHCHLTRTLHSLCIKRNVKLPRVFRRGTTCREVRRNLATEQHVRSYCDRRNELKNKELELERVVDAKRVGVRTSNKCKFFLTMHNEEHQRSVHSPVMTENKDCSAIKTGSRS
jgi:hypothetical protein